MSNVTAIERISSAEHKQSKQVNLVGLGLYFVPVELFRLKNLKKLWLSSNGLSRLPEELCDFSELELLWVNDNQLESFSEYRIGRLDAFPKNMASLVSLTQLNLSRNLMQVIPEALCQIRNLQMLDVSFNQITFITDSISNLQNLKKLELRNNLIKELPEALTNCQSLEQLWLHNNPVEKPKMIPNNTCFTANGYNNVPSRDDTIYVLSLIGSTDDGSKKKSKTGGFWKRMKKGTSRDDEMTSIGSPISPARAVVGKTLSLDPNASKPADSSTAAQTAQEQLVALHNRPTPAQPAVTTSVDSNKASSVSPPSNAATHASNRVHFSPQGSKTATPPLGAIQRPPSFMRQQSVQMTEAEQQVHDERMREAAAEKRARQEAEEARHQAERTAAASRAAAVLRAIAEAEVHEQEAKREAEARARNMAHHDPSRRSTLTMNQDQEHSSALTHHTDGTAITLADMIHHHHGSSNSLHGLHNSASNSHFGHYPPHMRSHGSSNSLVSQALDHANDISSASHGHSLHNLHNAEHKGLEKLALHQAYMQHHPPDNQEHSHSSTAAHGSRKAFHIGNDDSPPSSASATPRQDEPFSRAVNDMRLLHSAMHERHSKPTTPHHTTGSPGPSGLDDHGHHHNVLDQVRVAERFLNGLLDALSRNAGSPTKGGPDGVRSSNELLKESVRTLVEQLSSTNINLTKEAKRSVNIVLQDRKESIEVDNSLTHSECLQLIRHALDIEEGTNLKVRNSQGNIVSLPKGLLANGTYDVHLQQTVKSPDAHGSTSYA